VEERARSELGLIAANETYYQVVPRADHAPASTPAVPAAPAASLQAAAR
jgi:hypothetical protein